MNVEETAKLIEVMRAYVDGAVIESRIRPSTGPWVAADNPQWSHLDMEYRITPKAPRDLWVNIHKDHDGTGVAHKGKGAAEADQGSWIGEKAVHYRRFDDE